MACKNVLEKIAQTNPECEIWWDSSPLVYANWSKGVLDKASDKKKGCWKEQMNRLLDPANSGEMFFRGCTTNPPLSYNAIKDDPPTWAAFVKSEIEENPDKNVEEIFWMTYKEIVRRGAEIMKPLWDKSDHKYGYISGQVDPRYAYDYDVMYKQAMDIAAISDNVMVKAPGSVEGYRLIEELTAQGIATNNTTSFCVPQYMACMNAVSNGLEKAKKNNVDLFRWRSVITHMSARWGAQGDLLPQAEARGIELTVSDIRYAELALYKRAYHYGQEKGHPSKMLMCSMRVDKMEDGSDASWHIEGIMGSDSVYTCPPKYIGGLMEVEDHLQEFDPEAINKEMPTEVYDKLMKLPYFVQAYEPDGMVPEDFNRYGPFLATAAEFAGATRGMVDFVAQQFQAMGKKPE